MFISLEIGEKVGEDSTVDSSLMLCKRFDCRWLYATLKRSD
jgi:hypothetical protein